LTRRVRAEEEGGKVSVSSSLSFDEVMARLFITFATYSQYTLMCTISPLILQDHVGARNEVRGRGRSTITRGGTHEEASARWTHSVGYRMRSDMQGNRLVQGQRTRCPYTALPQDDRPVSVLPETGEAHCMLAAWQSCSQRKRLDNVRGRK